MVFEPDGGQKEEQVFKEDGGTETCFVFKAPDFLDLMDVDVIYSGVFCQ